MAGKITIALVVPTYNEAPFLRRCLESIKNQIVKFDEVIIVDDGSTDGSGEILEDYRGRFTVLYSVNSYEPIHNILRRG